MARVGIIGGTGFHALTEGAQRLQVETPWGDVEIGHRHEAGLDLFLLRRHGPDHLPPHRIVHRANVDALARCKVDAILALNAVGSLRHDLRPGSLLVPDDCLDLRKTTETFHDARAVHVDATEPYFPTLRRSLLHHAHAAGHSAHDGGTYACTEGPRLETRAEIRMLQTLGASVVGMTGLPEAALARERALCYATLCLVTNPAAGLDAATLDAQSLKTGAERLAPTALHVLHATARSLTTPRACGCQRSLDHARL